MADNNPLEIISILCNALMAEQIEYCHWKSNYYLDRSASGDNDLDLLVNRKQGQLFTETLFKLGFKETLLPTNEELPGVRNYYGYDRKTGKLIHVHAHFQLVLGNDLTKNYRIPIEPAYLASSIHKDIFRIPAPEFELVILVIRMILKHSTWDSILIRHGSLSPSELNELKDLSSPEIIANIDRVLALLPGLSRELFTSYLKALQPGCSFFFRIKIGEQVRNLFQSSSKYSYLSEIIHKFAQRIWQPILQRGFKNVQKKRLSNGGLFIAIVGGDGAGKTTAINELHYWLSEVFDIKKVHIGKPSWSWTTIILRGLLKIGTILKLYKFEGDIFEESNQKHGFPWFIRTVCTARDRYLTYLQARRYTTNGGLVLCDRYPLPGFMQMDGPQCEISLDQFQHPNFFQKFLSRLEIHYYSQIQLPDILIILKVPPEIAVQRKVDETEFSVRARSSEVWNLDWKTLSAIEIDASQPKDKVLSHLREIIWDYL